MHWALVTTERIFNSKHLKEGSGNPLQYSCLENPMDGGAWWAAVHGVTKSRTWLSDFTFTFTFILLTFGGITLFLLLLLVFFWMSLADWTCSFLCLVCWDSKNYEWLLHFVKWSNAFFHVYCNNHVIFFNSVNNATYCFSKPTMPSWGNSHMVTRYYLLYIC